MDLGNTSDLKDVLIFGEAESSPRNVVYKIQGKIIDGDYKMWVIISMFSLNFWPCAFTACLFCFLRAIEATNHTDEGTFVTSFTLKTLQDYYVRPYISIWKLFCLMKKWKLVWLNLAVVTVDWTTVWSFGSRSNVGKDGITLDHWRIWVPVARCEEVSLLGEQCKAMPGCKVSSKWGKFGRWSHVSTNFW